MNQKVIGRQLKVRLIVLFAFLFFISSLKLEVALGFPYTLSKDDWPEGWSLRGMPNTASSGPWSFISQSWKTPSNISLMLAALPISIDGNGDFSVTATVENWPGDGTQSFPYIIDGYNFTGSFDSNLIEIMNTDAYFRIRNCLLSRGWNGIHLVNVTNGEISNNTVVNNSESGIYIENSEKCILSGNTITNNSEKGISLRDHSEINILSRNTIANNSEHGLVLSEYSGNNTLSRNTVTSNKWNGITSSRDSGNNIISGNIVNNNNYYGIYLFEAGNNTILDNVLINNSFIIGDWRLEDYLQVIVTNNSVNGKPLVYWQNITGETVPSGAGQVILVNSDFVEVTGQSAVGVQGAYCSNLNIHHNIISNGGSGISLSNSNNSILTKNTVTNSLTGISIKHYSKNNTLANNTVTNNRGDGISIRYEPENNTLANNIVFNNSGDGIELDSAWFNTFSGNNVSNNSQLGIISLYSWYNTFSGNTIANNSWYGIYSEISGQNTFSDNNIANNSDYGIYFWYSVNNNRVVFNDFSGNKASGPQAADHGSSNTFAYNFWDEWISPDSDTDGIVANPYSIDGTANNQDLFPLAFLNPPQKHLLLSPTVGNPNGGEILSGDARIR